MIVGQRLDEVAMSSETGLPIKFKIGKGSFHIQRVGERKAVISTRSTGVAHQQGV